MTTDTSKIWFVRSFVRSSVVVHVCVCVSLQDHLTMFADYRVPQVLCHEGILLYSSSLRDRLERREEIPFGDEDECEIRAASILAVDHLVQLVNDQLPFETNIGEEGQRINAIDIDVFLWRRRRELSSLYAVTPFHRTRSIFY